MTTTVVVVDVGLGNLRSVEKAVQHAAEETSTPVEIVRASDPELIARADKIIVPGQGGFRDCARAFDAGLREVLSERLRAGTPYLGICLGLQVLFEGSAEAVGSEGLGWFEGHVERLVGGPGVKIPHMGWNHLEIPEPRDQAHPLLAAAGGADSWFYFVHSFHAVPKDPAVVAAFAEFGSNRVTAAVARDHVFATQFHPEKSQRAGQHLLAGFLEL